MSGEQELVAETTNNLLRRCRASAASPQRTWDELAGAGLLAIGVPEVDGGSGEDLTSAAQVVRSCARFPETAELPIAATLLLAHHARRATGGPAVLEPSVVAVHSSVRVSATPGGLVARGAAPRVPGAEQAHHLLIVAHGPDDRPQLVSLDRTSQPAGLSVAPDTTRAGLGLASITVDDVALDTDEVRPLPADALAQLESRARLLATLVVAGLLEEVLELTLRYARERQQFGRPIHDFQMVKHQLALLAGDVTTMSAAADAAVAALDGPDAEVQVRAARSCAARLAVSGARIAHQVHGTIGMTQEYPLHRCTRLLWHWSDADNPVRRSDADLGRLLVERGAERLWAAVAGA